MFDEELLTVNELAGLFKISTKTVYTFAKDGIFPAYKIGNRWRFKKSEVEKSLKTYLKENNPTNNERTSLRV